MEITVNLERTGDLGLPLVLKCMGFHADIHNKVLHLVFAICLQGLDGTLMVKEEVTKSYTPDCVRQDVDSEGVPLVDGEGNPVMISVFEFWEKQVGSQFIYPDLAITLEAIAAHYK